MEIYIGAPIQHGSERSVLREIERLLSDDQRSAIIFANISIASRQIDFILVLDDLVLVIEAKGYRRPVRGGENGPWQVQVAAGDWKEIPNLYDQALKAKYAVKDAMRSFCGAEVRHPAAALVFVPDIPRGSLPYSGDFKVSVIGMDGLQDMLRKRGENAWSFNRWRGFAKHLGLTRVASVPVACSPAMAEAENLLRRYTEAFHRTYETAEPIVPFPCRSNGEEISSEEITNLVSEQHVDLLIQGPSGCGKSMVAAAPVTMTTRPVSDAILIPPFPALAIPPQPDKRESYEPGPDLDKKNVVARTGVTVQVKIWHAVGHADHVQKWR